MQVEVDEHIAGELACEVVSHDMVRDDRLCGREDIDRKRD